LDDHAAKNHAMKLPALILIATLLLGTSSWLLASQRQGSLPFGGDDDDDPSLMPTNTNQRSEWTFARYHYPMGAGNFFRGFQRWAADYPKSDRQFVMGVRRLTRIDTHVSEQVVDGNSDAIFDWPWIFVEDAGAWRIGQPEALRLREYLNRGGFIFLDDTHGDYEWETLLTVTNAIFPGRRIEDLQDNDELFHVLYDLNDRIQIPGTRYIWGGRRYTPDSAVPKWRAIRDDQGRIVIAICHNSDVGDAWEWADSPDYPERPLSLAYRLGINFIVYGMTH
jgi:hypothetical protein